MISIDKIKLLNFHDKYNDFCLQVILNKTNYILCINKSTKQNNYQKL